jgi:hypothetical protein
VKVVREDLLLVTAWSYAATAALALEGYIEAKVYRNGDDIAIKFRRRQEAEG